MTVDNQLNNLVSLLYESVFDPEKWRQAIGFCGQYAGGVDALVTTVYKNRELPAKTVMAGTMFPLKMAENYVNHFIHIDPHYKFLLRNPTPHQWYCSHQEFNEAFVNRNAFYQKFLIPHGVRYLKFAVIDDNSDTFTMFMVMRIVGQHPFDDTHSQATQRFSKHLQRALCLKRYTQDLHNKAELATQALDTLAMPMLVVDSKATILHMNASAEKLLASPDTGICRDTNRLRSIRPDNDKIYDLLTGATGVSPVSNGMILKGKENRQLLVTALPVVSYFAGSLQTPLALVVVGETDNNLTTLDLLGKLYRLSPAELCLASALLKGNSLEEYAQSANVALSTVRTQLRYIFKKTGTRRQPELVALLGQVPPLNKV